MPYRLAVEHQEAVALARQPPVVKLGLIAHHHDVSDNKVVDCAAVGSVPEELASLPTVAIFTAKLGAIPTVAELAFPH